MFVQIQSARTVLVSAIAALMFTALTVAAAAPAVPLA
jgi:hypothetical protein